jgi:hypothetical protein
MADIKNVNRSGGNEIGNLTNNQVSDADVPRVSQSGAKANQTQFPVGQPVETRQPVDTALPPGQKVLSDAAVGREASQLEAAKQLSSLGGVSATDRLLGLDLRPTMTGVLSAPPGNVEFLRHLSPQTRRTIMRKMLNKQRERMRRLARYLRDRRDENSGEGSAETSEGESFLEVINEPVELDRGKIVRATVELEKAARMLNILDEMLAMQDYTISQIGTFTQG